MPAKIYYDRDREYYLNIGRDYYHNNRENLLKIDIIICLQRKS